MKRLFKQTKVIYDAHLQCYDVYYKNFLIWQFDQAYPVNNHNNNETAKRMAIDRAKNMLDTVEVYRSAEPYYYP
jgi:hypothetical protein